mmetsp:Transcript_12961/g.23363  ORF Transcript_12961/g.23363 Transcript_12961/m.23363 type:complete len:281 (-) Transcript_12961:2488-3330(-)
MPSCALSPAYARTMLIDATKENSSPRSFRITSYKFTSPPSICKDARHTVWSPPQIETPAFRTEAQIACVERCNEGVTVGCSTELSLLSSLRLCANSINRGTNTCCELMSIFAISQNIAVSTRDLVIVGMGLEGGCRKCKIGGIHFGLQVSSAFFPSRILSTRSSRNDSSQSASCMRASFIASCEANGLDPIIINPCSSLKLNNCSPRTTCNLPNCIVVVETTRLHMRQTCLDVSGVVVGGQNSLGTTAEGAWTPSNFCLRFMSRFTDEGSRITFVVPLAN